MDSKMSSKISSDRNYFDLTGQAALVTGCSSGIGIQMAKALASAGANIVAVARRVERVEAVAKEIAEEFGVKTLALHCDVRDTTAWRAPSMPPWRPSVASTSWSTTPEPAASALPRT